MRATLLFALLALGACSGPPASQIPRPEPSFIPSLTVTASPSNAVLLKPKISLEITHTPPTATPTPNSKTPTPPSPTPLLAPITPENAARLAPANKIQFSPWELVLNITWSPDGETLAVAAGEKIRLYQANTLEERLSLQAGGWTPGMAFSPDGGSLAGGGRDGTLRLWDTSTGGIRYSIPAHRKGINAVTFSPDGLLLASAGNDGMVRLWEAGTGKPQGQMIGGAYAIPALAFTSEGANLAVANGNIIRIRQVVSQRFVLTLRGDSPFYSLALAPDGQALASGDSNNTVVLWNLAGGDVSRKLTPNMEIGSPLAVLVWRVAFSPDGRLLASAGGDKTIRVWDVSSGNLLAKLTGHTAAVTSLAFSPDGRWLASGGLDARVVLWQPGL